MKKAVKIFLKTILWLFISVIILLILVQTPPVQNFIRKKAVAWLQKKLDTRVEVGRVFIGLPSAVVLENIYVEDKSKDTLLYGGSIRVNVNIFKLFSSEVRVSELSLKHITANVNRTLPDTLYNFQFIIDAFSSKEKTPKNVSDTAAMQISLNKLLLEDIRLRYKDTLSGNDATVYIKSSDTRINTFDPQKLIFEVPSFTMDGLTVRLYQSKPLVEPADVAHNNTTPAKIPVLLLKKIDLSNIDIDYRNNVSAFYIQSKWKNLEVLTKKFDLAARRISVDKLHFENSNTRILLGKKEESRLVSAKVKQEAKEAKDENWQIVAGDLQMTNSFFRFDNENSLRKPKQMDYAHLDAQNINIQASDVLYNGDTIAVNIKQGALTEQSGFVLQQLKGNVSYTPTGATISGLLVQTPGTRIERTLAVHYPSLESIKDHIERLEINADLHKSYVTTKDILIFAPQLKKQKLFADPSAIFRINGKVHGRIDNLTAEVLQVEALHSTKIDINGTIAGLPSTDNLRGNIRINAIRTTKKDLAMFIPDSVLTKIKIPDGLFLKGNIQGNRQNAKAALNLETSSGNVSVNGTVQNYNNKNTAAYNVQLRTAQLQLGDLLENKELQSITANIQLQGKGFTTQSADAKLTGTIQEAGYKEYVYRNVSLQAAIKNQQAQAKVGIVDPNIHFAADLVADVSRKYPIVDGSIIIDSIKTQALHLTPQAFIYRGKIMIDSVNTNPDEMRGKVDIIHSLFVSNDKRLNLDTVRLQVSTRGDSSRISLRSDLASVRINGKYHVDQLGTIFQQAIQPYFALMPAREAAVMKPYSFTVNVYVDDNPALKIFIPKLKQMQELRLNGRFVSDSGWSAKVSIPLLDMGSIVIDNMEAQAGTKNKTLTIETTVSQLKLGGSTMYNLALQANAADNKLNFNTHFADRTGKEKYNLSGIVQQPQFGTYVFNLLPDKLKLNYEDWNIAKDNTIRIGENTIDVQHFVLSKNNQQFSIQTTANAKNAIQATFTNFQIGTIASFVTPDSLPVDGAVNGGLLVTDPMTHATFKGDLTINNLNFKKDTLGDVKISANNSNPDRVQADVVISGRGNNITLQGEYFVTQVAGNDFNMKLNIQQLNLATIGGATGGAISNASGNVTGQFAVTGTMAKPLVDGSLNMKQTAFTLTMLKSNFKVDNETIVINREGVKFDSFVLQDSANNKATLDGMAYTTDFKKYRFDLSVRANNFRALNTTKKDNKIYFGQLYFSSNMRIKGTETSPVVDGSVTINEKTKLTVVLPQKEPGVAEREGVIQFIDMDSPENDTLFMHSVAGLDSMNRSELRGLDISANIEIKKEAELSLVIDETSGDFLRMKGEGLLTGGIDRSGKITLSGSYEMYDGTYELTFNFLRRKFAIQKGSRIVWNGEPTKATVDVTAVYIAKTPPLDLVKNQLQDATANIRNTYLQRLPFEVNLKMSGELLKPQVSFDIQLPDDKNYGVSKDIVSTVNTRLDEIRQDQSEINKQVFALLLLGRFVSENPFQSSTGGLNAETFARQSASKLLTEQLNQLAASLIQGVDINFDVASTEDYTTGSMQNRTDLNVGLSKRLLNDRLTVTVGSNFEVEGPRNTNQNSTNLAGNIAVDYQLSQDGKYLIRAYRRNEYEGVIDGYVTETGVGFIITLDYNRFRNIFLGKKAKEERRKRRQQERKQDKQPDPQKEKQTEQVENREAEKHENTQGT